jgi:hypothetical protein
MERLEQINKEIEELEEFLESKDEEFRGEFNHSNPQKSYDVYSRLREPYTSRLDILYREQRLIMPAVAQEDVEEDDDVMSLEEFIRCCECGGFIDYDGFGRYVKDGKTYNVEIYPSDVFHKSLRTDFDTIVWYNR